MLIDARHSRSMTKHIVSHLEKYLGRIGSGKVWKSTGGADATSFQLISFPKSPDAKSITYATLGLSNVILNFSDQEISLKSKVRAEVVTSSDENVPEKEVVMTTLWVAEQILSRQECPLNGTTIKIPEGFFPGNSLYKYLYCTSPLYFDKNFAVLKKTSPRTVFIYFFPITSIERDFLYQYGDALFVEQLVENEEFLLGFSRRESKDLTAPTRG